MGATFFTTPTKSLTVCVVNYFAYISNVKKIWQKNKTKKQQIFSKINIYGKIKEDFIISKLTKSISLMLLWGMYVR